MTDVEQVLIDAGKLADDQNKAASSRAIARKLIEICHGVIDLKKDNANLKARIKELEEKLIDPPGRITATEILSVR